MTEVDAGHRPRNPASGGDARVAEPENAQEEKREQSKGNAVQTNPNPQDSGDDDGIAESGRSKESGREGGREGGRGGMELSSVLLGLFETQQELGGH